MKESDQEIGGSQGEKKGLVLAKKIEEDIVHKFGLGFDVEVLRVLDDVDSSESQIEALTGRIDANIIARLFSMAEAVYFGQSKGGNVRNFYQVVSRLGMDYTKSMIFFFSLPNLSKSKRIERMLARGFAASVIGGKVIAKDLNICRTDSASIEIGGLLKDIGRIIILLYEEKCGSRDDFIAPTEEFVEEYHSLLGRMFVSHYALPPILKEIIAEDCFSCDATTISVPGIVNMAHSVVERSFSQNNGKLVIKSPMPGPGSDVTHSLGAVVESYFRAAGLMAYLDIVRVRTVARRMN